MNVLSNISVIHEQKLRFKSAFHTLCVSTLTLGFINIYICQRCKSWTDTYEKNQYKTIDTEPQIQTKFCMKFIKHFF